MGASRRRDSAIRPVPRPETLPLGRPMENSSSAACDSSTSASTVLGVPGPCPSGRRQAPSKGTAPSRPAPATESASLVARTSSRGAVSTRPGTSVALPTPRAVAATSKVSSPGTGFGRSRKSKRPVASARPSARVTGWPALVRKRNGSRSSSDSAAVIVPDADSRTEAGGSGIVRSGISKIVPAASSRPPASACTQPSSATTLSRSPSMVKRPAPSRIGGIDFMKRTSASENPSAR